MTEPGRTALSKSQTDPASTGSKSVEAKTSKGPVTKAKTRAATRVGLVALLFLLGLAPRVVFHLAYSADLPFRAWESPKLDARTFHFWATRIADGDLLSRDMIHPYHRWSRIIATPEEWESWYGKNTFHQAPLYPYAIAGIYSLSGPKPEVVHWAQALLGAALVPLAFGTTRRLYGTGAGWAAAILTAFCGPLILYEMTLLRTTLLCFLNAVLLSIAMRAVDSPTRANAAGLGVVQGLSILAKPTGIITLPIVLFVLMRRAGRRKSLALACLLPMVGVLLPAIARNVAVGASPLRLTTRGPEVFVCGNASGSTGIGWFPADKEEVLLAGHARTILKSTEGRLGPTIVETLKTHPNPGSYLRLLMGKTAAFLSPLEIPNNINYYEIRAGVPALRWAGWVSFVLIGPLALAGIAGAVAGQTRRSVVPLSLAALSAASVIGLFVVARFRLPCLPFLLPFAGFAVSGSVVALRKIGNGTNRAKATIALGVLVAGAMFGVFFPKLSPKVFAVPNHGEALFGLGGHLHASERLKEADEFYRRAIETGELKPSTVSECLQRQSLIALTRNEPRRAIAILEELFRTSDAQKKKVAPSVVAGNRINLGIARRTIGDIQGAAKEFRLACRFCDHDPDRLLGLAGSLEECGDRAGAVLALDLYLKLRPDDTASAARRARLATSE